MGVKHWLSKLRSGTPVQEIVNHFKQIAHNEIQKRSAPELEDLLDKDDEGKRIAIVMPQTENDIFLINSLLKNLKKMYKNHNIYFFTKPEYFCFIDDNPYIHKLLHYSPVLENNFLMEGAAQHEGLFEIAFYPHSTTQKTISYLHNGEDKLQFSLR
jgi:hypothetical protein